MWTVGSLPSTMKDFVSLQSVIFLIQVFLLSFPFLFLFLSPKPAHLSLNMRTPQQLSHIFFDKSLIVWPVISQLLLFILLACWD